MPSEIILKKNRDFSVSRRHPWIFSGAIDSVTGDPARGETVIVCSSGGERIGCGAWSPDSQITVRMWSWNAGEAIDAAFFDAKVARAVKSREGVAARARTNAVRLVNGEADGLPGVIADRYADFIVCQFTSAGADAWKRQIVDSLMKASPCKGIYERSDVDSRAHEGLDSATGLLAGEEPPELIEITENGCRFEVDVRNGHKTGFYLDQRDNRRIVAENAAGLDVLNTFCYTGGFGIGAGVAGARSVTHIDLSAPALAIARRNAELNGLDADANEFIEGNAFDFLRKFRDSRRTFDMIVLDPPKFVDSKGHLMAGCRGYKDINLLAMKLLRPGGILATFSCSGIVTPDIFHKVVQDAAVDSGRDVQVVRRLQQAPDHPEGISFPEGLYLKGLLCRVF